MSSNFTKTKGGANSNKVVYAKLVSGVPFQFRIVGDVHRSYCYWLKNAAGKSAKFENLAFDPESETFTSGEPDAIREAGITELNTYTKKVENIKSKRNYSIQVLNRATNAIEILDLKKSIFDGIINYMQDAEISDVTSVEWFVKKTGTRIADLKWAFTIGYCRGQDSMSKFVTGKLDEMGSK